MNTKAGSLARILVVDDEILIIRMLNEGLKSRYDLQFASTGEDALITAQTDAPELILLDVGLPDMDGYEVCQRLRDNAVTKDIPVIFLTGHDDRRDILRGFEAGGRDYVLKDASVLELIARINIHLQLHRQKVALESALIQNQMQNEKMSSLGKLMAGVAHEINNPMGYISGNLQVLVRYFKQILDDYLLREGKSETIEHILVDGSDLISESLDGANRVIKIAQELKNYSRMDAPELTRVQMNDCLESALTICYNELKYIAVISKHYEHLPPVLCHPGQLSQVFLNLLVNAGQAIVPMGEIVLKSWHDDTCVYASVGDNGVGIPAEQLEQIFEPFYTTKEVGLGTGLGLSISRDIVTKYHGELLVTSGSACGSIFTVKLPRADVIEDPDCYQSAG